jgi:hypothetical protein
MKLFTRFLINSIITFIGITAIGLVVDVIFGPKNWEDWISYLLKGRIFLNFSVAVIVSAYFMYRNKIKERKNV